MFPNYDHGRFSVIDDGTLVIESVVKEDAGEYVCKGLSIAGSAYAKARLEVRGIKTSLILLATCEAASYIILVVSVCQTIAFENLDIGSSYLTVGNSCSSHRSGNCCNFHRDIIVDF